MTYGDSVFLVSWLDKRGEFPAIYCARIRRDGTVIEHNGFPLHADSMFQISPVSAFDGTNFLLAWIGFDAGGYGVYAKRVSPAGTVLDSVPVEVCYGPAARYNPALSFDGNNYMLIWDDARVNGVEYDEWCARISTGGILIDTDNIPVDTSAGYQYKPAIAFLPPYFLAAWTDERSGDPNLVGKRIAMDGTVIEETAIPLSSASGVQLEAAVYAANERYFVAWEDGRGGYEQKDIYGILVDTAGACVGETGERMNGARLEVTASPNPFCDAVTIRWATETAEKVTIRIFDVCGRLVREHTVDAAGMDSRRAFTWDARDRLGMKVSSGIYFVVVGERPTQDRQVLLLLK